MHHEPNKFVDLIALLVLIFLAWLFIKAIVAWVQDYFGYIIVFNFQRGLHYRDGKLLAVLEAGRYLINKKRETIVPVDMREQVLSVVNQELICADSFSIRLSASVVYKTVDAQKSNEQTRNAHELLYLDTQLAMRELAAGMKVEEVLAQRNEISTKLEQALKPRAEAVGLAVVRAGIRDITFPADVKKAFTQVSTAEKAAQAQLAKSRAETASLRALANAAKMIENNPNLLALRSLQSISELSNSSGNTIVLGVPSPMVPLGPNKQTSATATAASTAEDTEPPTSDE